MAINEILLDPNTQLPRTGEENGHSQFNQQLEDLKQKISNFATVLMTKLSEAFSGKVGGAAWVGMDFSWGVRTLTDLAPKATKLSFFYQTMGLISCFNLILGVHKVAKDVIGVKHTIKIGDREGLVDAGLSLIGSAFLTVGGGMLLLYRPVAIISSAMKANSASLIGRVSYGLGQSASVIFGLFYMICGISGALNLYRMYKFYSQYYRKEDSEKKLQFISEQLLDVSDEAFEKKKAEMSRLVGAYVVDQILLGAHVRETALDIEGGDRISCKPELISKVDHVFKQKLFLNSALVIFGSLGIITAIAGLFLTSGLGFAVVTLAIFFGVILPMGALDAYCFYLDLQEKGVGVHDKKFLIVSTVVAVLAALSSIALTCIFSFGIIPILLTLLVSAYWIGMNAISYKNILNAEKKALEDQELIPNSY